MIDRGYKLIKQGKRTQLRRPVTGTRPAWMRLGKVVAVQPAPGKSSNGLRIRVLNVREQTLREVAYMDARAEGYRTTHDFQQAWLAEHDAVWLAAHTFPDENTNPEHQYASVDREDRFYDRWADVRVWVVDFEIDRSERPRYIADRNARADYVTHPARALQGEMEAVSEQEINRQVKEADRRAEVRQQGREQDLRLLAAEERLRLVRDKARQAGINVSSEMRVYERVRSQAALERLERKVNLRNVG